MAQTHNTWLSYLCFICLCYMGQTHALPSIDLSQHISGQSTQNQYLYNRDYHKGVEFKQVLAESKWQLPTKGVTNRGFSEKPSWMAFSLNNPTNKKQDLILEYVDASVESIDIYYREKGIEQPFKTINYTFEKPVSERNVSFYRPSFSLSVPEKSQLEIYVRIFQGDTFPMHCFTSLRIWQESDFYRSTNIEMLLLIILLCTEVFMGITAVFVYLSSRDNLFLYYAFFVFSAAGLFSGVSGLWGYFIMPNHYELWMVVFKINICQVAALLFIRRFLNLKSHSRLIDRGLLALAAVCMIGVISNLLGYPSISRASADCVAMSYILLIPIGFYAHKKGVKNALLFTASWVVFIIGMTLASLRLSGHINDTPLSEWMIYAGGFVEVILLCTIMVLRIRAMKKEKLVIQRKLDTALENAQDNNKIKDQFLNVFSHELRTPLNGIIGSLQLLEFTELSSEQKKQKGTATRSAKHLLRMVENILTFSELTSLKARSTLHSCDLKKNINNILSSFHHAAQLKSLTLTSEFSTAIPALLKLDWPNIQRILTYWLDNAIKFSHQGEITIKVECKADEQNHNYHLSFYAMDQGPGIKPEILKQIRQGFEQKEANTIRNIDGLGLGLANSIKIAELINAKCHVESTSEGTCYQLDLTCQLGTEEDIPKPQKNSDKIIVLAVDDNPINLMVLSNILRKNNMEVHEAKDGIEALEKSKQQLYHAIFMDCQMPNMDGYQATRCIRESDNMNHSTPIIAVTANAYESDKEHCLYVGMNDFVSKPIDQQTIMDAFKRWS